MTYLNQLPRNHPPADRSAFEVWLGRTLKASHEDAIHEPIPKSLLDLLPPVTNED